MRLGTDWWQHSPVQWPQCSTALYTVQLYSIVMYRADLAGGMQVYSGVMGVLRARNWLHHQAQLMNDCIIIITNHATAACLAERLPNPGDKLGSNDQTQNCLCTFFSNKESYHLITVLDNFKHNDKDNEIF